MTKKLNMLFLSEIEILNLSRGSHTRKIGYFDQNSKKKNKVSNEILKIERNL